MAALSDLIIGSNLFTGTSNHRPLDGFAGSDVRAGLELTTKPPSMHVAMIGCVIQANPEGQWPLSMQRSSDGTTYITLRNAVIHHGLCSAMGLIGATALDAAKNYSLGIPSRPYTTKDLEAAFVAGSQWNAHSK